MNLQQMSLFDIRKWSQMANVAIQKIMIKTTKSNICQLCQIVTTFVTKMMSPIDQNCHKLSQIASFGPSFTHEYLGHTKNEGTQKFEV